VHFVEGAASAGGWFALASLLFWAGVILLMIMLQRAITLSRGRDTGTRVRPVPRGPTIVPFRPRPRGVPNEREPR